MGSNDPDESDTLTYTVYFDDTDGLQEPSSNNTAVSEASLEVTVESGTYYWRVKYSDGKSSSSNLVYSFIDN